MILVIPNEESVESYDENDSITWAIGTIEFNKNLTKIKKNIPRKKKRPHPKMKIWMRMKKAL